MLQARNLYPSIKAVFVDTGLEYPEIREFVKSFDNVDWLRPKLSFKQVIEKYGYPFIGKEVSRFIGGAQRWKKQFMPNSNFADLSGDEDICSTLNCDAKIMLGRLEHKEKGIVVDGAYSDMYNKKRYKFAVDAPFRISNKCCDVMKKEPMNTYVAKTNKKAMTGQMASESKLREKNWLKYGCNAFDLKHPISNPMAFWMEQDVLLYIKEYNIPIASVYGEVVVDYEAEGQLEGQMDMSELESHFGIFDTGRRLLKTTGCDRTGCMFCGYGCHLEKSPNRFERMKETHPKQYDYIMRPTEKGGLNYKEVIDWINEHGNMNIKY